MNLLADLVFPRLCLSCQARTHISGDYFCVRCSVKLSFTNQLFVIDNAFKRRFHGRIDLKAAAAVFWYSKGDIVQKMIYNIKYDNQRHIGIKLGELMARQITESTTFGLIDCLVPVPIHPIKKQKRGFNQSELLVKSISEKLNIPYFNNVLYKKENTVSQTHKSRIDRLSDIENSIGLKNIRLIKGKHVLLVDDVLTTGATLEECAKQLLLGEIKSISMMTIAMGRL